MGVKKWWQIVSDFVFSNTNKDLLVFLFFLGLSGIFWLSLTLNETYEREFSIPVSVVDIPKNAVLTARVFHPGQCGGYPQERRTHLR